MLIASSPQPLLQGEQGQPALLGPEGSSVARGASCLPMGAVEGTGKGAVIPAPARLEKGPTPRTEEGHDPAHTNMPMLGLCVPLACWKQSLTCETPQPLPRARHCLSCPCSPPATPTQLPSSAAALS